MALRLDVLSGDGSLHLREPLEVAVREAVAERMGRDTASSLVLYMERDRMSRTIRFRVSTRDSIHAEVVVTEEYFFGIVDRYDLTREVRNLAAELAAHLSYVRPPGLIRVLHSMPEDREPLAAPPTPTPQQPTPQPQRPLTSRKVKSRRSEDSTGTTIRNILNSL